MALIGVPVSVGNPCVHTFSRAEMRSDPGLKALHETETFRLRVNAKQRATEKKKSHLHFKTFRGFKPNCFKPDCFVSKQQLHVTLIRHLPKSNY